MVTVELAALVAPALGVLFIFVLRLVGVAVATVRTITMTRSMEKTSAFLGFFEVLIYVLGIGVVVNDLGNIANLIGYCAGFSAGTIVGIRIERHLAFGTVSLQAVSRELGRDLADELRSAGYGVTVGAGEGLTGPVAVVTSIVPRREVIAVKRLVEAVDREAFVVIGSAQPISRGWMRIARHEA